MAIKPQIAGIQATVLGGAAPDIYEYPEAASQSFKIGQFVYLSSGKVTICADDAQVVLGMAAKDASGTTDTAIPVILATPDTVYELCVYHSTAASAVTAVAQVGENYALQVDSNKCYCDVEDTTAVVFRVIALSKKDTVGDRYGRVLVTVQPNYSQVGQAG